MSLLESHQTIYDSDQNEEQEVVLTKNDQPHFGDINQWKETRFAHSKQLINNFHLVEQIGSNQIASEAMRILTAMYACVGVNYNKTQLDGTYMFAGHYNWFGSAALWTCLALQLSLQIDPNSEGYQVGSSEASQAWELNSLWSVLSNFAGESWISQDDLKDDGTGCRSATCVGATVRGKKSIAVYDLGNKGRKRSTRVDPIGYGNALKQKILCFERVYNQTRSSIPSLAYLPQISDRIICNLGPTVFEPVDVKSALRFDPKGTHNRKTSEFAARVKATTSTKTFGAVSHAKKERKHESYVKAAETATGSTSRELSMLIAPSPKPKPLVVIRPRASFQIATPGASPSAKAVEDTKLLNVHVWETPTTGVCPIDVGHLRSLSDFGEGGKTWLFKHIMLCAKLKRAKRKADAVEQKNADERIETERKLEVALASIKSEYARVRQEATDCVNKRKRLREQYYDIVYPPEEIVRSDGTVYVDPKGMREFDQSAAERLVSQFPELKYTDLAQLCHNDDDDGEDAMNRALIECEHTYCRQVDAITRKHSSKNCTGSTPLTAKQRRLKVLQENEPGELIDYGAVFGFESEEEVEKHLNSMEARRGNQSTITADWEHWERVLMELVRGSQCQLLCHRAQWELAVKEAKDAARFKQRFERNKHWNSRLNKLAKGSTIEDVLKRDRDNRAEKEAIEKRRLEAARKVDIKARYIAEKSALKREEKRVRSDAKMKERALKDARKAKREADRAKNGIMSQTLILILTMFQLVMTIKQAVSTSMLINQW